MSGASTAVRFVEGDARRFGEFELIAKLGRGGMAEVFLASKLSRPSELLVVKRLVADLGDDEHRALFADESRIMAMLQHPNIVRTIESSLVRGEEFLAMEFLDGLPLDRCASVVTALGERAALHVASELLDGLHYAHELRTADGSSADLVHRDVSPHNVFLTYEGRVTLVDFGIAKSRTRAQHTATGVVRGKLTYMAPEQALCDELDRRADIFAVAVILWELLSGERFWGTSSDVQILKRMTFGELPELCVDGVRKEVAAVLARALAPKPEARFATARAFREALAPLAAAPFKRTVLGAQVSEAAGAYKGALEAAIDAHLSAARGTAGLPGIDDAPPLIEPPPPPPSLRGVIDPTDESVAATSVSDSAGLPAGTADDLRAASSGSSAGSDVTPSDPLSLTGGSSSVTVITDRPTRRLGGWVYVGAAMAVLVGLGVADMIRREQPSRAAAAATAPPVDGPAAIANPMPLSTSPTPAVDTAAPSGAVSSDAAPDLVEVRLDATPSDAIVTLDGKRIVDLPLVARFPRDRMGHVLVVRSGRRRESRLLVFDHDLDVSVDLTGVAGVRPPIAHPTSTAPTKLVDDSDPWAKHPKNK